ncbi:hypothetical protein F8S09_15590 [Deinococcus sp. SDU3-2]|uniref:Uncharacterized protein n=1 Tax=Deinococcus terrestris TaxID=2651870 RepID=A0A7X1TT24_9DEIO|nr:hypothetical protein [Deinococcus terrestris]MPY68079.1 hypothetical protein [Deinococcus terrestris]
MSAEKPRRFSGLDAIRKPEATAPAVSPAPPPPPADEKQVEPFSSHLKPATKRRLKQAAAKEGRKQFEALEQAVTEYLSKYHPDIRE